MLRLIGAHLERAPHHLPAFRKRAEQAQADRLHQHIADRGRFDGAGDDRAIARIGGELAQQRVLAAAADDVDRVQLLRLTSSSSRSSTQR